MPPGVSLEVLPLVTVIVPTFNRASFLEETIDSILEQDYPNIELIVLDDGSIDDTPDVLAKYGDRIIVERHDNIGETLTVNKGFKLAHGDYVCVVNSDRPAFGAAYRTDHDGSFARDNAAAVQCRDWAGCDDSPQRL
ncbi:MAG: glycosyltransferase [Alphaproteobacteria bacterium]|nr:MAG: glycosyltransferase [Alphaproteobacteria bacterium]